ncbi:MAG: hypothetical protein IPJ06_18920 [Saprospiraceae bacterium]|nr:hypothetical protein [Saprospiraceae bacterium]
MNQETRPHIIRFFVLVLLQVLILRQIQLGEDWLRFAEILIYPLIVMMLPMIWPSSLTILIAFIIGMVIDSFYDSPGVHAGASTFSAFVRPLILQIIAPRAGYDPKQHLTRATFGMTWLLSYTALFMFIHILAVQLLTVFTFYYWGELLMRTAFSWVLSVVIILLADLVFNPKS